MIKAIDLTLKNTKLVADTAVSLWSLTLFSGSPLPRIS